MCGRLCVCETNYLKTDGNNYGKMLTHYNNDIFCCRKIHCYIALLWKLYCFLLLFVGITALPPVIRIGKYINNFLFYYFLGFTMYNIWGTFVMGAHSSNAIFPSTLLCFKNKKCQLILKTDFSIPFVF